MKKISIKNRIKMRIAARAIITAVIAAIIIFSAYSAYAETQKPKTKTETTMQLTYTQNGRFDYTVILKNNTVYNTKILYPGQGKIFKKITDYLNMTFTYTFISDKKANIQGQCTVTAQINTDIWTKTYTLVPATTFNSTTATAKFKIEPAQYEKIIADINEETGVTALEPKLTITASIIITGTSNTDTFYESFSPAIEIPLNVNLIEIQTPLTQSQSDKIKKTQTITLKTSDQQLIIYIATAVVGAVLLTLFLTITQNKTRTIDEMEKTIKKIRKKYGEWIVDINNLPLSNDKQILMIKTLDDLIKISEELGKPVMHYTSVSANPGDQHTFYVIDENTHYKYVLTNEEKADA